MEPDSAGISQPATAGKPDARALAPLYQFAFIILCMLLGSLSALFQFKETRHLFGWNPLFKPASPIDPVFQMNDDGIRVSTVDGIYDYCFKKTANCILNGHYFQSNEIMHYCIDDNKYAYSDNPFTLFEQPAPQFTQCFSPRWFDHNMLPYQIGLDSQGTWWFEPIDVRQITPMMLPFFLYLVFPLSTLTGMALALLMLFILQKDRERDALAKIGVHAASSAAQADSSVTTPPEEIV